jgi:hypothetical protein
MAAHPAAAQPAQAAGQQQQQQQPLPEADNSPDRWEVNKPVERRSQILTEEYNDCFGRFWTWVSCGGPAARMRQLYVNGRLIRCVLMAMLGGAAYTVAAVLLQQLHYTCTCTPLSHRQRMRTSAPLTLLIMAHPIRHTC